MAKNNENFVKRRKRIRYALRKKSYGKLRLSVLRTGLHVYAQIIDDAKGATLVSSSTVDKELADKLKKTSNVEAAAAVGRHIAEKALKSKISEVVFDRGGYLYHGRVKALAEAARKAGLKF
jgi:large subunit ribosomal protein L18